MKDLALSLAGLARKKLRTGLLIFAVFIAFLIYAVLAAFSASLTAAASSTGGDRLTVSNKINFTQSLPLAYVNRVSNIEGVKDLSYSMWFGGYYQEQRNFLIAFAVEPGKLHPHLQGIRRPAGAGPRLHRHPRQRDGRAHDGRPLRLEARPADPAVLQYLDAKRRHRMSSPSSSARSSTARRRRPTTELIFVPYEYFDEGRAFANDQIGNIHVVTAGSDQNDRDHQRRSTRCSPIRAPRRGPRRKRPSTPPSSTSRAISASSFSA